MNEAASSEHPAPAAQAEVIAFLGDPASHEGRPAAVERIETHGAIVFLAGATAYKIKKAVRFPYMDFSTLDKRRDACRREIEINRPQAPQIYLAAVPITRGAGGGLAIDGSGEPVEWAVVMRRFDETATFDRLAAAGALDAGLLKALTDEIRRFHAGAPVAKGGGWARIAAIVDELVDAFTSAADIFGEDAGRRFGAAAEAEGRRARACLDLRARRGCVRRCHGDLHLRNIVLLDGRPVLFDAIEFDEEMATIDTLYDLAFLIMDLCQRNLLPLANTVLNRYLQGMRTAIDIYGLTAMGLFVSCRAGIRAMVAMNRAQQAAGAEREAAAAEARRLLRFALAQLEPSPARLIAVGGLSGTGKSTLAAALAPRIGRVPGALHLRSDVERKLMFDVGETERLGEEAYSREAGERVYARLRQKARLALEAGSSVVVDAVYSTPEERNDIEATARSAGVTFTGLWLEAAPETMIARVAARRGDASDATAEVVREQIARGTGSIGWRVIDAGGSEAATLERAAAAIAAGPGISG